MDLAFLALNIAALAAAALQSATGIGFGIIAGPILLVVLNDGSAIQVSILLNLLIAGLLTPMLWRSVDRALLMQLVVGLVAGTPVGVLLFLAMDIVLLKLAAAVAVILTLVLAIRNHRRSGERALSATGNFERRSVGAIGGLMGGSLGIPGPVPAAWMSANGYGKDAIRATILAMFVVAYTLSLGLQMGMVGIDAETFYLSVKLAPATLIGIFAGRVLNRYLTEETFRKILWTVLSGTVILLLATLV